ncbi:phosphoadenylyl-sulfate reductase [Sandaracinobacteroides sp. A072]|uniref:phosphoadenylyl-sulfate reductase n=1 Tax=Sandaracinobacteroides sp. A072 TaxID=3461146 RepID=UPI0040426C2D
MAAGASAATGDAPVRQWAAGDAPRLAARHAGQPTERLLADILTDRSFGRIAIVSSFGAESAVLLHLVAQVRRDIPVLFVETGWLFPETLAYAEALAAHLRLTDVRWLRPDPARLAEADPRRLRWSWDPDGCCEIRKVQPLDAALQGFDLWLSGRKSHQSSTRAALPLLEADGPRLKLNPLHDWTAERLAAHAAAHALPPHPLVADGYPSIGCSPCTSRVRPGEDPRAGRWRGWDKTECGIHKPAGPDSDPVF